MFVENQIGKLTVLCLSFSTEQWKDIIVGDVLRIHNDQVIPVRDKPTR